LTVAKDPTEAEKQKEQSAIPALSSQKASATQGGEFLSLLNKNKQHAFLKSLLLPMLKGALVVFFFFFMEDTKCN